MSHVSTEIWVSGHVQGVWFRAFTQKAAQALGVTGYVENLPDGRVHLVAEGTPDRVAALLARLEEGPPGARVDHITSEPVEAEAFTAFTIRY
ncbi:MAG: acylphosphatase [Nitrospirae bacterium]|nr:acylphosphatase [Nitrospirota bacterium]